MLRLLNFLDNNRLLKLLSAHKAKSPNILKIFWMVVFVNMQYLYLRTFGMIFLVK